MISIAAQKGFDTIQHPFHDTILKNLKKLGRGECLQKYRQQLYYQRHNYNKLGAVLTKIMNRIRVVPLSSFQHCTGSPSKFNKTIIGYEVFKLRWRNNTAFIQR